MSGKDKLCKIADSISFRVENTGTTEITLAVQTKGGEGNPNPVSIIIPPNQTKDGGIYFGVGDTILRYIPSVLAGGNQVTCNSIIVEKAIADIEGC